MKKLLAIMAGVALIAGAAEANLLLRYAFGEMDDGTVVPSLAADLVADNISASNFSATEAGEDPGEQTININTFTDFSGEVPSNASGDPHAWVRADTFLSEQGNETTQGYLSFTITPDAGFFVSLTGLGIAYRSGGNAPESLAVGIGTAGPGDWAMIEEDFPNNSARWNTATLDYEGAVDEAVEIRIYGWGGSNPGAGQFRFDDVQVFGSVIPEPGTMALVVVGFAGLVAFARRRRA